MSREALPFATSDLSALARFLSRELEPFDSKPGHVQLLNMLARGGGYRNYQHFKAQQAAKARLEEPPAQSAPVDYRRVEKVAGHFDEAGGLVRWPSKTSEQVLCLWALWSRVPAGVSFTEREISALLVGWHAFGDPALLRREMFQRKMVSRTLDCRDYRRLEQRPPAEAVALIRRLTPRFAGAAGA